MLHTQALQSRPRTTVAAGTAVGDYAHVRRAIEFLSAEWETQPSLERLAEHLGLSPMHVQRLFKRWCGLSPKEFVQAITMERARRMLEGSATVLEAAHEVGLSGAGRLHDLFVHHEAMTPGEFKRRGEGLEIAYGFHPSPFGVAVICATARGVAGLAFADSEDERDLAAALDDLTRRWPMARIVRDEARTQPHAQAIFGSAAGAPQGPVRVVMIGSDFEVKVWRALLRVPRGSAVTYSDIARAVGAPKAQRAVGTAVGRNPISFVVPCHRVLRKDGSIGGYHWGVTRKRAIIGWEQAREAAAVQA